MKKATCSLSDIVVVADVNLLCSDSSKETLRGYIYIIGCGSSQRSRA